MARDKVFRVRLTQQEWGKLENAAQRKGISSAELIRDYIKQLPSPERGHSSATPLPQ
ncbi:CopG domain protein DNA-binding domain protein (plasmid) [Scytonema sp. HK-05]|uniref:ribbon-helix-helix protein, CopG family n=1 Tax=Scytonema sp. HK-05 TaxID=1137095 RepID=UPI000A902EDB|nr:ribbon-helix-helix protein, CopG family [Scytonema sp. HK-05]BAY50283.1 CopG domain protein DNA-binding domain protein [Scytonema sp. HK-05]